MAPVSRAQSTDGTFIYDWSAARRNVVVPATTYTSGHVDTSGSFSATFKTYGGGVIALDCRIRIVAGPDNVIQEMVIVYDSIGMWHKTRCHEVIND
jgi:hypothetical protein